MANTNITITAVNANLHFPEGSLYYNVNCTASYEHNSDYYSLVLDKQGKSTVTDFPTVLSEYEECLANSSYSSAEVSCNMKFTTTLSSCAEFNDFLYNVADSSIIGVTAEEAPAA